MFYMSAEMKNMTTYVIESTQFILHYKYYQLFTAELMLD